LDVRALVVKPVGGSSVPAAIETLASPSEPPQQARAAAVTEARVRLVCAVPAQRLRCAEQRSQAAQAA
jgi:hypothetical protein